MFAVSYMFALAVSFLLCVSILYLLLKPQHSWCMWKSIKESPVCINVSHWCESRIAHRKWLDMCLGVSVGLCVSPQAQSRTVTSSMLGSNTLIDGHKSVMSLMLFLSGRHEGKIAELHLPALLLFRLMLGAVKPSRGFFRTSWHPPRPPKHDGWESWRAWLIWGQ